MDIIRLMLLSRQMKNRRHEKNNMVTGIPPLTFTANKKGLLKNYRIYGQTSRNLFNFNTVTNGYRITWATGALISDETAIMSDFIPVKENVYQINIQAFVACYNSEKNYLGIYSSNGYIKDYSNSVNSFTIDNNCKYVRIFTFRNKSTPVALTQETMLNSGSTLLPYEPYGESVGDRTGNLFDGEVEQGSFIPETGIQRPISKRLRTKFTDTPLPAGTYTINAIGMIYGSVYAYTDTDTDTFDASNSITDWTALPFQFTLDSSRSIRFSFCISDSVDIVPSDISNLMLNEGSTALPYEPYGYKIPVTNNSETANIYLDEPLAKSGNNADYIDYAAQKRHNSDGTESSVTLPEIAVTAGTNTFTIGTEVQPSRVELTGRIKEAQTNGSGNT